MINNIIDIYHGNSINFQEVQNGGIVAIIHKATQGARFRDSKYHERREQAKQLGFLWGAYHFSTGSPAEDQVENFLSFVKPSDDELIALDWEPNDGPDMTLAQARTFVQLIKNETGRWPVIYGGHLLRESIGQNPDPVLSNCPLWYARYSNAPIGIPAQVWPTYTLWQYTDGNLGPEPRETPGVGGADRNIFNGTLAQLAEQWPFTRREAGIFHGAGFSTILNSETPQDPEAHKTTENKSALKTVSFINRSYKKAFQAIQQLYILPESVRTEFYDSEIAPRISELAAFVTENEDPWHLKQWLYIQYAMQDLAVEGISEITYRFFKSKRQELEEVIATMPMEQQTGLQLLMAEFSGESNLSEDFMETASLRPELGFTALSFDETGFVGQFEGTTTSASPRGFPVAHGTFKLFEANGGSPVIFTANSGGGARTFRERNGPLPPGIYRVSNHRPNRETEGMVLNGVGYSFDVDPTDGTQVFSRSLFRIHPDGLSVGTNGCIGIKESREKLRDCEQRIAAMLRNGPFKIRVLYPQPGA